MSDLTFAELMAQMVTLSQAGQPAPALDLLAREAARFPAHAQRLCFWRMCLAARLDDTPLALALFEDLLNSGSWVPADWLRDEPDLQPLRSLLKFERLVEVCRDRQAAAQARAEPVLIAIRPEKKFPEPYPLLLALHGNYRNAKTAIDFWHPAVAQGWLLALPQSSQVFGPDAFIWDDRDWAVREIRAHYQTLCEQYAVDRGRVVVAGFSAGGSLALWLALSGALDARGFVVVTPGLAPDDEWTPLLDSSRARGLRGYVITGEKDMGYAEAQSFAALLRAHGIACELEAHPGLGHDFPSDFDQSLTRALASMR